MLRSRYNLLHWDKLKINFVTRSTVCRYIIFPR